MTVSTSRRSRLLLAAAAIAGTAMGSSYSAVLLRRTHPAFVSSGVRNNNANNIIRTIASGRGHERSNDLIPLPMDTNSFIDARYRPHHRRYRSIHTIQTHLPSSRDDFEENLPPPPRKTIFDTNSTDPTNTTTVFGPLLPLARTLDTATSGWALSYADLHPATPRTPIGQIFLATNFCYAAAGLALGVRGEWTLGLLTELAGVVSFWYHYSQLELGKDRSEVRLALLVDYVTAGAALLTGGVYMVQVGVGEVPWEAVVSGGAAVGCLSLCWVWEFGYPYLFWHSLWHVLSAYTGFLVGQEHIEKIGGMVG